MPPGAAVDFRNRFTEPPTFTCLQELGALRPDIVLGWPADAGRFPYVWLLTHDSKATPFTRLLFAMTPGLRSHPRQVDGVPIATVASPRAVARAWALDLLTRSEPAAESPKAPAFVRENGFLRPLRRFWGEGVTEAPPPGVDETVFDWARSDLDGLREAARAIAGQGPIEPGSGAARLRAFLARKLGEQKDGFLWWRTDVLLQIDPDALVDAVAILHARPDAIRSVLLRAGYTDPAAIGGALDRGLPAPVALGKGVQP